MRLDEASVKVRSGPPKDAAKDMQLDYWAGVIPLALQSSSPQPDPELSSDFAAPAYTKNYRRTPTA